MSSRQWSEGENFNNVFVFWNALINMAPMHVYLKGHVSF